jgi:ATP-binding cassette subfamily F protein 3
MRRLMSTATPEQVRARLGRFGFSGDKANVEIGKLSGGERARLNFGFITYDAPALLILDEPTNHLDIQAREALVEALNDFEGTVVLISHDRHLIELTADQLWLVANGTAKTFDGDLDDYQQQTLAARGKSEGSGGKSDSRPDPSSRKERQEERRAGAARRRQLEPLRKKLREAETEMNKLSTEQARLDAELALPATYADAKRAAEITRQRGDVASRLAAAEAKWLEAQQTFEQESAALIES